MEERAEWGRQRAKEDIVSSASSAGGFGVFLLPRTDGVGVLLRRVGRGGRQWGVKALVWRGLG